MLFRLISSFTLNSWNKVKVSDFYKYIKGHQYRQLLCRRGECPQTPLQNRSVLRVAASEWTLQTLWNSVYDKFLIISAFLSIRQMSQWYACSFAHRKWDQGECYCQAWTKRKPVSEPLETEGYTRCEQIVCHFMGEAISGSPDSSSTKKVMNWLNIHHKLPVTPDQVGL